MANQQQPSSRPSLLAQTQAKKYVAPPMPGEAAPQTGLGPPPGKLKPDEPPIITKKKENNAVPPASTGKTKFGWGRSLKPVTSKKEDEEENEEEKTKDEDNEEEDKHPSRPPSAQPTVASIDNEKKVPLTQKADGEAGNEDQIDDVEQKKLKAAENRLKTTKAALVAQMDRVDETVIELEKELEALVDARRLEKQKDKEDKDGDAADLRFAKRETEGLRNRLQTAERHREQRELFLEERNQEARDLANRERELKENRKAKASETEMASRFLANKSCKELLERDKKKINEEFPKQVALENRKRHEDAENKITAKDEISLPGLYSIPREEQTNAADIAKRVYDEEKDESKRGKVREMVMNVLRKRKKKLNEKEYTLALTYLKHRERWRVSLMLAAAEREKRERMQNKGRRGITGQGGGSFNYRPSSRNQIGTPGGSSYGGLVGRNDGVARSEYEEMQMIKALQRKEELKTLCKVPDMILDEHEKRIAIFDSRNGLVEDPKGEHDREKFIRPWTEEEVRVYHEKFSAYGKNFRRISNHLPGRDTADCVVYYYRNQKTSDGFKARRKAAAKKRKLYADARKSGAVGSWVAAPQAIEQSFKEREERSAPTAEARLERAAIAAANKVAKAKARAEKKRDRDDKLGGGGDDDNKGSFSDLNADGGHADEVAVKRQKND